MIKLFTTNVKAVPTVVDSRGTKPSTGLCRITAEEFLCVILEFIK
jgi:hypothetical protein